MQPSDVAQSYNKLADHWNSDKFDRNNGIAQHERAIAFANPNNLDLKTALDVGCGSSGRIIDLLTAHEYTVEGLDLSQEMLVLARQRHPSVTFHHADICTWQPTKNYDFISAWDSIWHIPQAEQVPTMQKLLGALSSGGVMIFTTGGVDEPAEITNDAMGVPMYHSAPGIHNLLNVIQESGAQCRHLEYDQYPEPHVYLIAQNS